MKIIDLSPDHPAMLEQAARLLVDGFRAHWPNAWQELDSAREEVSEALESGKIARAALDEAGTLLGWIGAIPQYDTFGWELHPLVVAPSSQGRGVGRALVADLEAQVRARGGTTIYLGSDDEDNMTSLSGIDLYPNVWEHIARIRNLKGHPYEFYQKQGYVITGVIPDANGPGKPDILMAKFVGKKE
ncbi:MAG: GNAT family N-acetyltransferase [Anaerolineales bacterium]